MADIAVTNTTLSAFGVAGERKASAAATSTTANAAETFAITPSKAGNKLIVGITNTPSTDAGSLAYSFGAGVLWAGQAVAGTVAFGEEALIQVETGKHLNAAGKIILTLTPATGKKLLTDHAATVYAIECV